MKMHSRIAAGACVAVALATPAAAPAMPSAGSAAQLEARALADARAAGRNARHPTAQSRSLIRRSLQKLQGASALRLKLTRRSGSSGGLGAGAKSATSFLSAASDEVDALLRVLQLGP